MPTRIVIASGNTHKAEEIQALLGDGFECRTLKDYPDAPEVEEDAATFAGNAVKKALSLVDWLKHHEDFTEGWVLADDSGLEVDALDGAPGVRSARYASDTTEGNSPDEANNAKLLIALDGKPEHQRTARFRCVLALARAGAYGQPELFEGACEGTSPRCPPAVKDSAMTRCLCRKILWTPSARSARRSRACSATARRPCAK